MFFWLIRWAAFRAVALVAGVLLYVYAAVQYPQQLRIVQVQASALVEVIGRSLPAQYAVWLPALNLASSLTTLAFVLVAMLVIELVQAIFGFCIQGIWRLMRNRK